MKKKAPYVFFVTAFEINTLTDRGLLLMSFSDETHSYLITTVPRKVAEQGARPSFETYDDAMLAIERRSK